MFGFFTIGINFYSFKLSSNLTGRIKYHFNNPPFIWRYWFPGEVYPQAPTIGLSFVYFERCLSFVGENRTIKNNLSIIRQPNPCLFYLFYSLSLNPSAFYRESRL